MECGWKAEGKRGWKQEVERIKGRVSDRERERVKAEHHDCKSWLNFLRSVASTTWAEQCNNYPSNSHTGRLTSPLRLHPDLLPLLSAHGCLMARADNRALCKLKWGRDCVRELGLLVSASVNRVCESLDQAGLLIGLVCLIARGLGGQVCSRSWQK